MPDYKIQLKELTKRFPGQEEPAVDRVTMDIPEGEIVVFVGPSGCGKTTTMKMVNRLIEPTSGQILIDGQDVTHADPDELRRGMGYVIQQIGLFPHQTIRENVATVPRMLGWDSKRIDQRIDELLDTVGLDPTVYKDRYPKELSGGQRQRVGVSRALAADPPILLMDEPFGAIDPITRSRLQNEFLRLQEEINKTIIFVTHDIDEAIKMGDRIAILKEHSHIAQFDTPEVILTAPASQFVSDFIGSGASLKRLNLSRVRDVDWLTDVPTGTAAEGHEGLRKKLNASEWTSLLLLDDDGVPQRWLQPHDLRDGSRPVEQSGLPAVALVEKQATLNDAVEEMLAGNGGLAIIVDGKRRYQGVLDIDVIMQTIRTLRDAESDYHRAAKYLERSS